MGNEEQKRYRKVKDFFSVKTNLILVGILILAFIIRMYYFYQTSGQAVWWDEAEYLSTAKQWAFNVPYDLNPQRPPLFQALAAFAFILGLGENFIKFAFVIIPSVFLVYAIYLLGKEMFNEKIGLIAAFLSALSWTFLFWSARVQPDFLSMSFQALSIYFMWKYWKKPKTNLIVYSAVFAAVGFYFKVSALLVPMIFIVFIFLKDRFSVLKNKDYWIFAIVFLATLIPYFVWSYFAFGTTMGFTSGYIEPVAKETPFGWYNIDFYYKLTGGLLFLLFLGGAVYALKFLLYVDILIKEKNKCFDPYLFSILSLLFISAFYIFHIKNTDDRWVFLWMPFIFYLVGGAVMNIYDFARKYGKGLGVILIIVLLGYCGYVQHNQADELIKLKQGAYAPVKEAGLLIKSLSEKNDLVASISYTQTVYYSERNVSNIFGEKKFNQSEFTNYLLANKPRFIEVSFFEPYPAWLIQSGQQNGYNFIVLPYFNSSIVSQNNKVVSLDVKPEVTVEDIKFTLIYPKDELNGMFVYEITYPESVQNKLENENG